MSRAWWLAVCRLAAAVLVAGRPNRPRARRRLAGLARGDQPAAQRGQMLRMARWRPPTWVLVLASGCVLVSVVGVAAGPVAGFAVAAYFAVVTRVVRRRRADQMAATVRVRALDTFYSLAADLRAGVSPGEIPTVTGDNRLAWLAGALRQVADQTGAPLADLLEKVAADARATDRIRAVTAAQSAGAWATAYLLAALPVAGIVLGYAIGADPLRVILHTPLGAGCAAAAIALQIAGLEWSDRIIRSVRPTAGVPR